MCKQSSTVQFEYQEYDVWCWVACARMLCSAYMTSPLTQKSIAVSTIENELVVTPTYNQEYVAKSQTADINRIKVAVKYAIGEVTIGEQGSILDTDKVRDILLSGSPIIAFVDNEGHFVLIHDYEDCEGTDDEILLYVYDPYNFKAFDGITRPYEEVMTHTEFVEEYSNEWEGSVWIDLT